MSIPMIKEREEEFLWDTIKLLREQNRFENALALFKTLIERTFLTLRLSTNFLEEFDMNLPSNEFVNLIRMLDKEIYQSLKSSDTLRAYETLVEYIEKLSEIIPEADRNQILAQILAEHRLAQFETDFPIVDIVAKTEVYTSTEVAEIMGVSDQTIRRWCEKEKYPDAYQTEGGHWRIPKKYFRMTLEKAQQRENFEQELNEFNAEFGEVNEDEFL